MSTNVKPKQTEKIDGGGEQLFERANNEMLCPLQLNQTEQTNLSCWDDASPAAAADGQASSSVYLNTQMESEKHLKCHFNQNGNHFNGSTSVILQKQTFQLRLIVLKN